MSQATFPGTNKSCGSSPASLGPKPRYARWYIPLVAVFGIGFGAYNYYTEARSRHQISIIEEEKRLAMNRELMDAYGSKESLHDMQQALESYQAR